MTARVLVVDDIAANVRLLQARLMADYFQVVTATNGPDALKICQAGECDIVLLDVMMPGMDGYEVCRRLKSDATTATLPVIMLTSLDQPSDRLQGLEAGADDFLSKPFDDIALTTRVKSLSRLKMMTDELQMRVATGEQFGFESGGAALLDPKGGLEGKVLIVDDSPASYERTARGLARDHSVVVVSDPQEALFRIADEGFDLVIVSLAIQNFDALQLCSQLRSLDRTRNVPILLVTAQGDQERLLRAIELGVNDYVARPVEASEARARARTQVRRKRLTDALRDSVQSTMEMAVKDGLTGLNNRRYFDTHVVTHFNNSAQSGRPLSLVVLDIDHFKAVNDTHGHQAGDAVLKEFAARIAANVRAPDLACRFGGEEFVVVMPDSDPQQASILADRMRQEIAARPFAIDGGAKALQVTVSAGVSGYVPGDASPDAILARADEALYDAKRAGRNQVVARAA